MPRSIKRVAVLGAGAGGLAAAATFARAGLRVSLYNRNEVRLRPVVEAGGVTIDGEGGDDEFVPIDVVTSDPAQAMDGADLALCCVAANGQEAVADAVAPHVRGQTVFVLAPGSAGSLVVAQVFERHGLDVLGDVLLGEMLTLPLSSRMTGQARVRTRLPSRNRLAAFPAARSDELYEAVDGVIEWVPSPNVLDTGLNNVNFLIHPGPMLLNYAAVERADGRLSLMNEGMTPGVLRCLDAIDAEKMQVCAALGLEPVDIDSIYVELGNSPTVYRSPGEPFNLTDRIWPRYIHEDTPFGTVMISSVGQLAGVPTPVCDGVNTLLSVLEGEDFWASGRTVDALGLAGMSIAEVDAYLRLGQRP